MVSSNPERTPFEWVSHETKGFPTWVTETFSGYTSKTISEEEIKKGRLVLSPHQRFVRDYMQHKSPYRGLLLYHGLGVGKTCASIAIAEIMKNKREVIVMVLASLQVNYRTEIIKCGNEEFAVSQHWTFLPLTTPAQQKKIVKDEGLDPKLVKQFMGYWVNDSSKKANFDNLSSEQQQQVKLHLQDVISKRYSFINYNGLTLKKFKELSKTSNIFDNKLVIIDEAHMFISRVVNKSSVATEVYKDLINAHNLKIVLLTGTPIINYPHEIAFMFNLLNGINKVYKIEYKNDFTGRDELDNDPSVLNYELTHKSGANRIDITLTPPGFIKSKTRRLKYIGEETNKTDDVRITKIINNLESSKKLVLKTKSKYIVEKNKLFPSTKDEFDKYFLNIETNSIKNEDMFMRRMSGIVSYYQNSDSTLYPENLGTKTEIIPFSDHQFSKYSTVRDDEIKKEKKRNQMKNMNIFDESGVYRTFSRVLCNFAFPDEIERPFPKNSMSHMNSEIDLDEESESEIRKGEKDVYEKKKSEKVKDLEKDTDNYTKTVADIDLKRTQAKKKYELRVKAALLELDKNKTEFLLEKLHIYSPKYKKIIENIESSVGTSLVYSQFKMVEGLGLLGMSLRARGYAEMKVSVDKNNKVKILVKDEDKMKPKYAMFSTEKGEADILLKIFNNELDDLDDSVREQLTELDTAGTNVGNLRGSFIKIMMITQSGSAGISLRNVRQVHVMEPYWNKSRIDQVIGRANRTNSHINLPKSERNFKVFMYRMQLTAAQKLKSTNIQSKDKNLSTDETMFQLADRKDQIVSKLLDVVRKGSVDCSIHKNINKNIECYAYPLDIDQFERSYLLNIEDDLSNNKHLKKTTQIKVKPFKVTIETKQYIWVPDTYELFDYQLYVNTSVLNKVGSLKKTEDGWYNFILQKNKEKKVKI
jgi:hypothetical protein